MVKNVLSYFKSFSKLFDAPIIGVLARKSVGVLEEYRKENLKKPNEVVCIASGCNYIW